MTYFWGKNEPLENQREKNKSLKDNDTSIGGKCRGEGKSAIHFVNRCRLMIGYTYNKTLQRMLTPQVLIQK